ncbi:hypothetical protein, partial [Pseudoxanthomonas sp. KAs_5_3]|uniref:hypothetical protein n=1 Tax=Pseudoxanthomonas sp. KAs_5_3 TaxID=2067658 RepID=UPI0011B0389D
ITDSSFNAHHCKAAVHRVAPSRPLKLCARTMLTRQMRFVHVVQLAQTLHGERHAKHEDDRHMTLLSVPIIDLAPYFGGTAEG